MWDAGDGRVEDGTTESSACLSTEAPHQRPHRVGGCFLLAASKDHRTENHREASCPIFSHFRIITFVVPLAMLTLGQLCPDS